MRISVFGLGKLGSPLAAVLADAGHDVMGVDVDVERVRKLNAGEALVEETGLAELTAKNRDRIRATTDGQGAAGWSDVIFIVVPTPSQANGAFSGQYVVQAAQAIGHGMRGSDRWRLVVLVSTVMPGTCENEIVPMLEAASNKICDDGFGFCYSPEFIALGSVIHDLQNPDFFLVGESDERAGDAMESIYVGMHGHDILVERMNYLNAEVAKLSLNAYVTMKISFANMVAGICERLPAGDAWTVLSAIGLDSRIGGKYLMPGAAYGGPCFPRDGRAFRQLADLCNAPCELSEATDAINQEQTRRLAEQAWHLCGGQGAVAVLGLAYKPNTNIAEESAGVAVANELATRGVPVMAYDPKASPDAERWGLHSEVCVYHLMSRCVEDAVVILVMTAWPEFAELDAVMLTDDPRPTVIDCWGIVDREKIEPKADYKLVGKEG